MATQQRYNELIEKRDARTLTPEEYQGLLELTDRVELLNAKRMEHIFQLARIRKQPVHMLLEEFRSTPGNRL